MKERPVLFSAPMVRAILESRKTQTRRIVRYQPIQSQTDPTVFGWPGEDGMLVTTDEADGDVGPSCPYGQPGDRLWVRETWRADRCYDHLPPRDIPESAPIFYHGPNITHGYHKRRPGKFMLRRMSRITLEVTGVRVERLQEIKAKDILAEGAVLRAHDDRFGHNPVSAFDGRVYLDLQSLWVAGWDKINGKRAPWSSNPLVWVIEFKRVP